MLRSMEDFLWQFMHERYKDNLDLFRDELFRSVGHDYELYRLTGICVEK